VGNIFPAPFLGAHDTHDNIGQKTQNQCRRHPQNRMTFFHDTPDNEHRPRGLYKITRSHSPQKAVGTRKKLPQNKQPPPFSSGANHALPICA
jgi:hypothetical protein